MVLQRVASLKGMGGHAQPSTNCSLSRSLSTCASIQADLKGASPALPGLPPSSTLSFLRLQPNLPHVVLTEFDRQFENPYYHGQDDLGERDSGMAETQTPPLNYPMPWIIFGFWLLPLP